jgi:hypothetical protein
VPSAKTKASQKLNGLLVSENRSSIGPTDRVLMTSAPKPDFASQARDRKADTVVKYLLSCLVNNVIELDRNDEKWKEWFRYAGVNADDAPSADTKTAIINRMLMAERLFKATIS